MHSLRSSALIVFLILLGVLWGSCRNDLEYAPSAGNLEFSKDTVFLDTVFTGSSSSTRTLKVYNPTRDDIEIPVIRLAAGQNSSYRLNVDGESGKEFENIPILARDSIFIFIESTYELSQTEPTEFLYTDALQFDTGTNQQEVQLVTLVKDAIFLFPRTLADGTKETLNLGPDANGEAVTIEGFYLEADELDLTEERPYVIYGYAAVPEGRQLRMAPGTRVFFHKDSGILVEAGASLQINGEGSEDPELLEREVIFQGDRLEAAFDDIPGQWGTVWIASGSVGNTIDHLTLRNATVGILAEGDGSLQNPTLEVRNSQIVNSASINLWGRAAFIRGENLVLGGAGSHALYCNLGGTYSFTHSTIANYWQNGFRTGAALALDNFDATGANNLNAAEFVNCIIDGNTFLELELRTDPANAFNYSFSHCLIKFRDSGGQFEDDPLYDFEDTNRFEEILLNEVPNYFDSAVYDFRIADPSPVRDQASFEGAAQVPFDLLGVDRTGSPDIGAYEVLSQN